MSLVGITRVLKADDIVEAFVHHAANLPAADLCPDELTPYAAARN